MIRLATAGSALCVALLVAQAAAHPGSGQLAGRSVLTAGRCGHGRASFAISFVIAADGTWSAEDSDGRAFAGSWTPKGRSGRKLDLVFDGDTEEGFVAVLAADIAELCELPEVTVDSAVKKALTLTVNRKGTRVTLAVRYALRGTAAGRPGAAGYRMKAKGPWTPASEPAGDADRGYRGAR